MSSFIKLSGKKNILNIPAVFEVRHSFDIERRCGWAILSKGYLRFDSFKDKVVVKLVHQ